MEGQVPDESGIQGDAVQPGVSSPQPGTLVNADGGAIAEGSQTGDHHPHVTLPLPPHMALANGPDS